MSSALPAGRQTSISSNCREPDMIVEQIVEVMRDAAGQLAEGIESLRMRQLFLGATALHQCRQQGGHRPQQVQRVVVEPTRLAKTARDRADRPTAAHHRHHRKASASPGGSGHSCQANGSRSARSSTTIGSPASRRRPGRACDTSRLMSTLAEADRRPEVDYVRESARRKTTAAASMPRASASIAGIPSITPLSSPRFQRQLADPRDQCVITRTHHRLAGAPRLRDIADRCQDERRRRHGIGLSAISTGNYCAVAPLPDQAHIEPPIGRRCGLAMYPCAQGAMRVRACSRASAVRCVRPDSPSAG